MLLNFFFNKKITNISFISFVLLQMATAGISPQLCILYFPLYFLSLVIDAK